MFEVHKMFELSGYTVFKMNKDHQENQSIIYFLDGELLKICKKIKPF